MREVLPTLVAAGIEAGRAEDKTGSTITLRKVPRNDATNTTQGEHREDKPKTDGIKTESDATANATGRSNATPNANENPASGAGYGNSGNRDGGFSEAGEDTDEHPWNCLCEECLPA